MKITKITQQVKRQNRYSIFVDEKYSFSLSETALIEKGLHTGQELTKEEVAGLKSASADDKLYNQALRYTVIRPRSVWEMQSYLQRKGSSPALTDIILNKLSNIGLLSDESFAKSWVQNRRLLKPVSYRRLTQELRQKHVPSEIIQQVLGEDETDERTTLRELIERKRKQPKYQDKLKLMQFLARQGFKYDDIKSVLEEID